MTLPDWFLETVRWSEGSVRILDQTRLPDEEVYVHLRTVPAVIEAIRTLAVRGAPAIGVAGAFGLALGAAELAARPSATRSLDRTQDEARTLSRIAEALIAARPTAINLRWAVERCHAAARQGENPAGVASLALAEAERILEEDLELSRAMARPGAALLPARGKVLTHCNTGGLATAGGGTALGVVLHAVSEGKELFVHVDETRPLLQGARLTAWELRRAGIPHAVNCDGAAAWIMKTSGVDAVLVGADRIARNGDTANKIGTFGVALAAKELGVPFYVVAPRSSFDLSLPDGDAIPIEERAAEEVLAWPKGGSIAAGSAARNPAFDVTPARLIAGWVTERGVERPPFAP